jgi:hypothetical protein
MFLLVEGFLWFTSTFATMVIAAIPTAETGGNVGNLMFSMSVSGKDKFRDRPRTYRADICGQRLVS